MTENSPSPLSENQLSTAHSHAYRPWSKWKRRRVHFRWAVADFFHNIGYRVGGDL